MTIRDAVEQLFTDAQDIARLIAPIVAFLGIVGLGVMYMGSSLPLIGDWKKDNPKAANSVVFGLFFMIFASSVTTLITL
jgi:hypothetical protein